MDSRYACVLVVLVVSFCGFHSAARLEAADATLFSEIDLNRVGLTRAWYSQVAIDRSISRVAGVALHEGSLFVQTDNAMLTNLDAETGRTRWEALVGRPDHPSTAPGANRLYVAVVNGSRIYVLDRETGALQWERRLINGPGAGPALTKTRVYVPMINGRIESYVLEDSSRPPWVYSSAGRALIQPVTAEESVSWSTDLGFMYVGRSEDPGVRYRLETDFSIASQPAYQYPFFYTGSLDGYVYSVHELSGNHRWRFSAGDPISRTPAVVGDRVFVCPDRAGMYCLSTETGVELWWAPRITRFLGASPDRVFATDEVDKLYVLDAKTGARIGVLPFRGLSLFISNSQTDRVYLGSTSGLIQCLHDVSQVQPLQYHISKEDVDKAAEAAAAAAAADAKEEAPAKQPAGPAPDPFGGADPFGGGGGAPADDPFGGGNDAPADDPFGGGNNDAPADDGGSDPFDDPFG
ncbi:MAG: PQQ-binding-like beta-propeller repeat protein [Planctomycetales bacterium]|nr:PQQ-binding-like beta-propeller repeat protein [Planctomycetales bacterium]